MFPSVLLQKNERALKKKHSLTSGSEFYVLMVLTD